MGVVALAYGVEASGLSKKLVMLADFSAHRLGSMLVFMCYMQSSSNGGWFIDVFPYLS